MKSTLPRDGRHRGRTAARDHSISAGPISQGKDTPLSACPKGKGYQIEAVTYTKKFLWFLLLKSSKNVLLGCCRKHD